MADRYDVLVKVISQKGTCNAGHKVGDEWVIDGKTPEGICLSAFNALSHELRVLRYGGKFPWETDPDFTTVVCSDPNNPVLFELRRLRE